VFNVTLDCGPALVQETVTTAHEFFVSETDQPILKTLVENWFTNPSTHPECFDTNYRLFNEDGVTEFTSPVVLLEGKTLKANENEFIDARFKL
jgi:hypothetical protein